MDVLIGLGTMDSRKSQNTEAVFSVFLVICRVFTIVVF